ncbi:MAG: hypothetical protein EBR82_57345 [Caulobacteraceae bacterium]|nr:hypothetical protein [Caulobacteraceae bacterium]
MHTMKQGKDMRRQKDVMKKKKLGFDKLFRLTRFKKPFLSSSRKSVLYWMQCHQVSQQGLTQATQSVQKKQSKIL